LHHPVYGVTIIVSLTVVPFKEAVMVGTTLPVTVLVVMVKLAEALRSKIVTVSGTVAHVLLDDVSVTIVPPAGALLSRVMVPLVIPPP
jgi:hypothetical protein